MKLKFIPLIKWSCLIVVLSLFNTGCSALNPYYYNEVGNNKELIEVLTNILDENSIPYLNMYASNKDEYEPGTLKAI